MYQKDFLGLYFTFLLLLSGCVLLSCGPGNSNSNSTPIPIINSRKLGSMQNFPWREIWRLEMRLLDANQNARNFVATKEGIVFLDNPLLTGGGDLLKLAEADQGTIRWETKIDGFIQGLVSDNDSRIYAVGRQNSSDVLVTAYDLQTGNLVWQADKRLPTRRPYVVQLQGQNLYVYSTIESLIYVFDPVSGTLIDHQQAFGLGEDSSVVIQLDNDDVLKQQGKDFLVLISGGQIVWRTDINNLGNKFVIHDPIQLYDNMIITKFSEYKRGVVFNSLAGIDLNTGKTLWYRPNEVYSNFIIVDNLLYVISKEARILVINPRTGETVGFAELLPNKVDITRQVSAISANENRLYVHFFDSGELIAFEKLNK